MRAVVRKVHQVAERGGQVVVLALAVRIQAGHVAQTAHQVRAGFGVHVFGDLRNAALIHEALAQRGGSADDHIRIVVAGQREVQRLLRVAVGGGVFEINVEVVLQVGLHRRDAAHLLFAGGEVVAVVEHADLQRLRGNLPAECVRDGVLLRSGGNGGEQTQHQRNRHDQGKSLFHNGNLLFFYT